MNLLTIYKTILKNMSIEKDYFDALSSKVTIILRNNDNEELFLRADEDGTWYNVTTMLEDFSSAEEYLANLKTKYPIAYSSIQEDFTEEALASKSEQEAWVKKNYDWHGEKFELEKCSVEQLSSDSWKIFLASH